MNLQTVPFKRTLGVEMTFIPKKFDPWMNNLWDERWNILAKKFRQKCLHKGLRGGYIHNDPGCVEYPSPILYSWKEAQEFYEKATEYASELGLTTFSEDQEGGMGHVHIGGLSKINRLKMINDVMARPYLGWVFATPNGSRYCRSIIMMSTKNTTKNGAPYENHETEFLPHYKRAKISHGWDAGLETFVTEKNSVINYHPSGTLEFRAFDAAHDWETQEEHMAFVQRYTESVVKHKFRPYGFIQERGKLDEMALMEMYHQYHFNIDLCIKHFKELILNLELPWKRYEWYIERNLIPAFEFGERQ